MSAFQSSLCLPDTTIRERNIILKVDFNVFKKILIPSSVVWAESQPFLVKLGPALLVVLFSGSGVGWGPPGTLGGRWRDPGICETSQHGGTAALQVSDPLDGLGRLNHVQLKYVTPGHGLQR